MTRQLIDPIQLVCPPRIAFGADAVAEVGRWLAARRLLRPLVVADAVNTPRIAALGLPPGAQVFHAFHPEPDTADLDALLAATEAGSPDAVIGFGGGSAMDLAKLAAVLAGSGQRFADVVGAGKVAARRVALVQVPSTAGTGSEAGTRALVTDPASKTKLAVESEHMLADLVVVDPDLTRSVPRQVTVATGVDALAHCVEAFTSRKAHPVIDLYALEGVRLVGRWLARAAADGEDREARAGMALAALYGGFCLGPVNTTGGHAVAYPLGSRLHIPHGAANALIFPHVLAYNAPATPERTAAILTALGLTAPGIPAPGIPALDSHGATESEAVFMVASNWCADLGCEMHLSAYGVRRDDLPGMADDAAAIRRLLDNNPRPLARDDILAIYHAAF